MPPPVPRCSSWAYSSLISPSHFSLPRYGSRVGLHIDLFEACSAFTRVAACTLALSPIRDTLIEGFSHFVTSMTAPIASGWSDCRVGLAPTGKRRLLHGARQKRSSAGRQFLTAKRSSGESYRFDSDEHAGNVSAETDHCPRRLRPREELCICLVHLPVEVGPR
jgi:hypothetical protein